MTESITILVAGNESLYEDLLEHIPASCRVTHTETIGKTLDRADEASVVLVDAALSSGSEDLCRQLRARAETSRLPIFICAKAHVETRYADRVLTGGLHETLTALREKFPQAGLKSIPGATYRGTATEEPVGRRSEAVQQPLQSAWPPSPPIRKPGQDLLSFTQDFTDYIASLVETHNASATLSGPEQQRLSDISRDSVTTAESVLDSAQDGVNEALRAQNVGRMREFSSAKTALFERLRSLRIILGYTSASHPQLPAVQGVKSQPGTPSDSPPTAKRSTPGTGTPTPTGLAPKKSAITLAAERKQRKRTNASAGGPPAVRNRRPPRPPRKAPQRVSARRANQQRGSFLWGLAIVAALGVVAVAIGVKLRSGEEAPVSRGTNAEPVMKYVTIQETLGGMIARPEAEDAEHDRIIYNIRWFVDGNVIADAGTARLTNDRYEPGNSIQVEVTPSDPHGSGQPMVSQPLTAAKGSSQTR